MWSENLEGVLDSLTRLVLVNAVYLKAPWETPFEKALTRLLEWLLKEATDIHRWSPGILNRTSRFNAKAASR